jgi:branched-chain amino acid transport system permease protein
MARWWLARGASVLGTAALIFAMSRVLKETIDDYPIRVLVLCGIYIILALSLNLINGITGQFSIGHGGFYGVGAYCGAAWTVLALPHVVRAAPFLALGSALGDTLNLLIALAVGSVAAASAGFVVGLPSLRLRGDYLAIVTLGFGEVIRVIFTNMDAVGGARGLSGIPTLTSSGGLEIFWVFLFVALVAAMTRNLAQSVHGTTYLAVREDEIAADAMGVNTTRVKVSAFVIGAAFAGAAGALYAHYNSGIVPDEFGMDTSIIITTMVVLGGTGSVTGAAVAAVLLYGLPEALRIPLIRDYRLVIFSTLLVVMMLTRPQGIFGHSEIGFETFRRLFSRRRRTGSLPQAGGGV